MRTIETDLLVNSNGKANVLHMPADIRRGIYHAVVIIDDGEVTTDGKAKKPRLCLSSYPVGLRDPHQTFSREELYDDNGR